MDTEESKTCLVCGVSYIPVYGQYERQRYCSSPCKSKMVWMRRKERGLYTGGYSRYIYIVLWLKAMGMDKWTAFCHYCNAELQPDKFNIDHKVPRSVIRDSKKLRHDIDNMVISCVSCNASKGGTEYSKFKERIEANK